MSTADQQAKGSYGIEKVVRLTTFPDGEED